jgi:pimeloyl-ACP methyl ester carboxylesterase
MSAMQECKLLIAPRNNYRVEGQGEPLVMISGFSDTLDDWKYQIPPFKKHFQLITMDNRGVGKTDKPQGPYSIMMMADDTIGLMDYLNIKKGHILGISMGGAIAQEIAIHFIRLTAMQCGNY